VSVKWVLEFLIGFGLTLWAIDLVDRIVADRDWYKLVFFIVATGLAVALAVLL